MIRRYNYTNRIKLPQRCITIRTFTADDGVQAFEATIDLSGDQFPLGANIYIEAYYRNVMMRFPVGQYSPKQERYSCQGRLTELQDPQVNFRVKLVDESETIGRIVALADKVQTYNPDTKQVIRIGLLPVKLIDLGDQVWVLEIPDDGTDPVLCINSSLNANNVPLTELVRTDPALLSLVFPQVVRSILERLLLDPDSGLIEDDPDHWSHKWLRFATSFPGVGLPPEGSEPDIVGEKRDWIESVVQKFCTQHNMRQKFEQHIAESQRL